MLFVAQIIITGFIIYYAARHFDLFSFKGFRFLPALVAMVLILINIGLEAAKFGAATEHIKKLSFVGIFKLQVHAINIGLLTPNRVGELFYKIAVFKGNDKTRAVESVLYCGIYQFVMTLLAAAVTILCVGEALYGKIRSLFSAHPGYVNSFFAVFGFTILILAFYFVKRQKFASVTFKQHIKLFLLSAFRYTIFVTQFYFILRTFGATESFAQAFYLVSLYFLLQNVIPSGIVTDLPTRIAAATAVGLLFSFPVNSMIQAVLGMYLMNAVLPALVGFQSLKEYKKYKLAYSSK